MKKTFINPKSYAQFIAKQDFKDWVLRIYKHPWHDLCNETLWEAVTEYNKTAKLKIDKFWD
ncbi:MAG: hypothetical protein U9R01_02260 [candidate division WOR-3 bacterium]|nr:hypothetical protein [candidate division WOR-3 bacterium]